MRSNWYESSKTQQKELLSSDNMKKIATTVAIFVVARAIYSNPVAAMAGLIAGAVLASVNKD